MQRSKFEKCMTVTEGLVVPVLMVFLYFIYTRILIKSWGLKRRNSKRKKEQQSRRGKKKAPPRNKREKHKQVTSNIINKKLSLGDYGSRIKSSTI